MLGLIVKKQELEDNLDRAQLCVDMVTGALQTLNQEERLILDRFYISCQEVTIKDSQIHSPKGGIFYIVSLRAYGQSPKLFTKQT